MTDDQALQKAKAYAFRLLSYRDRSEHEMVLKLRQRGYSPETIEMTIDDLRKAGFLDDGRLARFLADDARERRCLGEGGVRNLLRKRGIPRDVAEQVAGRDEDSPERAERFIVRYMQRHHDDDVTAARKKLWGLLMRRGYVPGTIARALDAYFGREREP